MRSFLAGIAVLFFCPVALGSTQDHAAGLSAAQLSEFRLRLAANDGNEPAALVELQNHKAAIAQLVPEIGRLLGGENDGILRAAVRTLGLAGPAALNALPGLIARLDHHDYVVRSEILRTLESIGPGAIPQLKVALESPSPRVRATALAAINRLGTVDAESLERLAADPDPRVRLAVAEGWKEQGKTGVERIVPFLRDPETVVAVGAARALRFNFADPALAVRHLAESLARKDVSWEAAIALQSFGVEAQSAIPHLIRSYPAGWSGSYFRQEDVTKEALDHIGPPRLEDLDAFRALLRDDKPYVRALAARAIGQLGTAAAAAAPDLERAFQELLEKHKLALRTAQTISDEDQRVDYLRSGENRYWGVAATTSCTAFWKVTRDTRRFAGMVEAFATNCGEEMAWDPDWDQESLFATFETADTAEFMKLLDRSSEPVRISAEFAAPLVPANTLETTALERLRRADHWDGPVLYAVAGRLDERHRPMVLECLRADLEDGSIDLETFAKTLTAMKFADPESMDILREKIANGGPVADRCVETLAGLMPDNREAARLLIDRAKNRPGFRRAAIEAMLKRPGPADVVVPFATGCLEARGEEIWTCKFAIFLLAKLGPAAKTCLTALDRLEDTFQDDTGSPKDPEVCLRIAIARALITEDRAGFQQLVNQAMNVEGDDAWRARGSILYVLRELGPDAEAFMDDIARLIQCSSANRNREWFGLDVEIHLLGCIGGPRAMELLRTFQTDRDWMIRSKAIETLELLEKGERLIYDRW